jgi:NAD(P)-dependent dehydrogenase (short-subunit alcohol dehydrogenase family)
VAELAAAPHPLAGKRALVTGAARGLGLATARALVAADAQVAVNDRTEAAVASALVRLGAGVPAPADLAADDGPRMAVERALAGLGGLDILVNNAAVNVERPIDTTDPAHWDLHLAFDLRAPFFAVQAALPALRRSRGVVVNIASELGLHAMPDNVAYVAAKHGLVAMTRALAMEFAPDGVRVNALCPGAMDTELMRECAAASGDPERYLAAFATFAPLGRVARPEEVAEIVLLLCAPVTGFVTGAAVAVDGGSTAGRR